MIQRQIHFSLNLDLNASAYTSDKAQSEIQMYSWKHQSQYQITVGLKLQEHPCGGASTREMVSKQIEQNVSDIQMSTKPAATSQYYSVSTYLPTP